MTDPAEILESIQNNLNRLRDPLALIEKLVPHTMNDALTWARHLSYWDEGRGRFPDQAIAVARIVSLRGMTKYGLVFDGEGRVVEGKSLAGGTKKKMRRFPFILAGQEVQVEYTPGYFARAAKDLFSFVGEPLPDPNITCAHKPHALNETGWLSHYAARDAVVALGGPEAYAAAYAEAVLQERDHEFEAVFNGPKAGAVPSLRNRPKIFTDGDGDGRVTPGEHAAKVVAEESPAKPRQATLF